MKYMILLTDKQKSIPKTIRRVKIIKAFYYFIFKNQPWHIFNILTILQKSILLHTLRLNRFLGIWPTTKIFYCFTMTFFWDWLIFWNITFSSLPFSRVGFLATSKKSWRAVTSIWVEHSDRQGWVIFCVNMKFHSFRIDFILHWNIKLKEIAASQFLLHRNHAMHRSWKVLHAISQNSTPILYWIIFVNCWKLYPEVIAFFL